MQSLVQICTMTKPIFSIEQFSSAVIKDLDINGQQESNASLEEQIQDTIS